MSQAYVPGPVPIYCGVFDELVHLGFAERGVDISFDINYSEYLVDVGGNTALDFCVPPGTAVKTPSGVAPIESLKEGDAVVTAEGNEGVVTAVRSRPFKGELVGIGFGYGAVLWATPEHPVLTRDGYVPAGVLRHGACVRYDSSEGWATVIDIEGRPYDGEVFNIDVSPDSSFVAEGVGVHNCYQGANATISAQVSNWNERAYALLCDYSGFPGITSTRGTEVFGQVGVMMGLEEATFELFLPFPYATKSAYAAGLMPAGYHFPSAFLVRDHLPDRSGRPAKLDLSFRAIRAIPNSGQQGSLSNFNLVLYDHDMTKVAGLPL